MSDAEWAMFLTGMVFGVGLCWLADIVCRAAFRLYDRLKDRSK